MKVPMLIYVGIFPDESIGFQVVKTDIRSADESKLAVPLSNALKLCDNFESVEEAIETYCEEENISQENAKKMQISVV